MPLPYVWYRQKVLKPFVSALCIFLLKIPLSIRKCGAKKKKTKTTKPEKKNKLKLSFGVGGGERFPNGGLWAEEIMYEWRAAKTFVQSKVECIISSVRQYNFFLFLFCVSPFSTNISAFISSRLQVRKKTWGTSFPPLVSSKA